MFDGAYLVVFQVISIIFLIVVDEVISPPESSQKAIY